MTIKEKLVEDMKLAMKAGESGKVRLSVIRMARAAIRNAEIDSRREFGDEEVIEVLAKEIRQRRDAAEEYRRLGKPEAADALEEEIRVLQEYMPAPLSEEELTELVQQAIREAGAASKGDLGKVMKLLMPKVKGRADGKAVRDKVSSLLP
ncbi:MAG: GatB/YqeY domain-containing protein [Bacillota bacterium]